MNKPLIFIGSDHRGFPLKAKFTAWLQERGCDVRDVGPETADRCDAQDYAVKAAEAMRGHPDAVGILICMTGQVMTMTANRYKHLRAAMCLNTTMARLAREHNDANVMTLGAYVVGEQVAFDCLETFLNTKHLGGTYAERVCKMTDLGGL
jgi:ribose 5-phosphate isomerase B